MSVDTYDDQRDVEAGGRAGRRSKAGRLPGEISKEELQEHFHQSIDFAAHNLKVGLTTLKKLCRHYNIKRWPFRKVQQVQRLAVLTNATTTDQLQFYELLLDLDVPATSRLWAQLGPEAERAVVHALKTVDWDSVRALISRPGPPRAPSPAVLPGTYQDDGPSAGAGAQYRHPHPFQGGAAAAMTPLPHGLLQQQQLDPLMAALATAGLMPPAALQQQQRGPRVTQRRSNADSPSSSDLSSRGSHGGSSERAGAGSRGGNRRGDSTQPQQPQQQDQSDAAMAALLSAAVNNPSLLAHLYGAAAPGGNGMAGPLAAAAATIAAAQQQQQALAAGDQLAALAHFATLQQQQPSAPEQPPAAPQPQAVAPSVKQEQQQQQDAPAAADSQALAAMIREQLQVMQEQEQQRQQQQQAVSGQQQQQRTVSSGGTALRPGQRTASDVSSPLYCPRTVVQHHQQQLQRLQQQQQQRGGLAPPFSGSPFAIARASGAGHAPSPQRVGASSDGCPPAPVAAAHQQQSWLLADVPDSAKALLDHLSANSLHSSYSALHSGGMQRGSLPAGSLHSGSGPADVLQQQQGARWSGPRSAFGGFGGDAVAHQQQQAGGYPHRQQQAASPTPAPAGAAAALAAFREHAADAARAGTAKRDAAWAAAANRGGMGAASEVPFPIKEAGSSNMDSFMRLAAMLLAQQQGARMP